MFWKLYEFGELKEIEKWSPTLFSLIDSNDIIIVINMNVGIWTLKYKKTESMFIGGGISILSWHIAMLKLAKHSPCFYLCDEYFGLLISNNIIGIWFCILKFYYGISKCMTLMCSIVLTKIIALVWNLNIWGGIKILMCLHVCY